MQQATTQPDDSKWRFRVDNETVGLRNLTLSEALDAASRCEEGTVAGERGGACVQLEFDSSHAAVLYMGPDKQILRPYFPNRPAESQDISPYFCKCCGVQLGPKDEYLSKFFSRDHGVELFVAIVKGPELPKLFPGMPAGEDAAVQWIPLPTPSGDHGT
jgi:hypothetical protein